jgi:hypothetical protein
VWLKMERQEHLNEEEAAKMVYTKQELEFLVAKINLIEVDIESVTKKILCI